ncbi:MAG: hypothetical protein HY326_12295 [Chloroflexi bacterium]|nr:hypothetical protein [Chloroflexota bacterium]
MADNQKDSSISRRSFLKRTLAVAAGLGGASLLAACGAAPTATPAPPAAAATQPPAAPTTAPAAAAPTAAPTKPPAPAAPTAAPTKPPAAAATGGTMTVGYGQKTSYSHFMHMRSYAGGETVYSRTFANAKLVQIAEKDKSFYGDLAEKYELAQDGKSITFTLRKGLKWPDGEAFTAKDVEFTILMAGRDLGGYRWSAYLSPFVPGVLEYVTDKVDKIDGMHVIDDNTIKFDLIKPPYIDLLLGAFNNICIAPVHLLSQYLPKDKSKDILTSEWATTAKHIGMGPFKVVEYVPDQFVTYEPNPNYHFGKPKLGKLVYRSFQDRQTLAAALEKKEIDVGWIPDIEYTRLQKLDFLDWRTPQAQLFVGTTINTRRPYLADKRIRQALLYAMDRDAMIKNIYANISKKIDTPFQMPRIGESPNLTRYNYDVAKAKQLLKDGGWDGKSKVRWLTAAVPSDTTIYDAINGYWKAIGVDTEFQISPSDVASPPKFDFDLYWSSYPLGHPTENDAYLDSRKPESYNTGYDDKTFQDLKDKSTGNVTDDEMKKLIYPMQEMVADAALFIMICPTPNAWGIAKRVHNILPIYMATGFSDWGGPQNWTADA